jgi:hypothetical protein
VAGEGVVWHRRSTFFENTFSPENLPPLALRAREHSFPFVHFPSLSCKRSEWTIPVANTNRTIFISGLNKLQSHFHFVSRNPHFNFTWHLSDSLLNSRSKKYSNFKLKEKNERKFQFVISLVNFTPRAHTRRWMGILRF